MSKFKIGIQLFSLRDEMAKDFEGTLKAVAEMGYECVEFAGYFDHSAEEIKAICDKYNLEIASVHHGLDMYENQTDSIIATLKTFGVKNCGIAYIGPEDWQDNYDSLVERITKIGKVFHDNGIQLIYHNHEYELQFEKNGMPLLDAIYTDIPEESLLPQLDLCWVHYGGKNPVDYIRKYGHIEEVIHLKDFECEKLGAGRVYELIESDDKPEKWGWNKEKRSNDGFKFLPLGCGRQDIRALMAEIEKTNIKYVIAEQDGHYENTGLEDAKISIDYLRSIGY